MIAILPQMPSLTLSKKLLCEIACSFADLYLDELVLWRMVVDGPIWINE